MVPRSSSLYIIDAGKKESSASILISTLCDGEDGSCLIYGRVVVGSRAPFGFVDLFDSTDIRRIFANRILKFKDP